MVLSTIYRQRRFGPGSPFARALGAEVRRQRRQRGLTQAELGAPLTRSYVSAVELGRTVPSVPALAHMAARLGTDPGHLLPSVTARGDAPGARRRSARVHASPDRHGAAPDAAGVPATDLVGVNQS